MSKYNKETLQKLEKNKLVRLLEKEGIEASVHQPKTELIRLLMLAKRANSPTSTPLNGVEVTFNKIDKKKYSIAATIAVLLIVIGLYGFNSTFQRNINFIFKKAFQPEQQKAEDFGPSIYEKNGKTYVVYDYPLISVKAIYDPNCKRPECSLETYFSQIKSYISPLVKFTEIEYLSREGENLTEKYNLNLLPVFIFDTNIEKTENFENSKRNLEKVQDKYILQVPPTKLITGPKINNARTYQKATNLENEVQIIEFTGFSCKLCYDSYLATNALMASLGENATRIFKYFNTGEKDLPAAVAAECAAQQDKFKEYSDILFTRQDGWVNTSVAALNSTFTGYAVELGLNRNLFNSCLVDENVKQIVISHYNEAGSLGISAAPTLVIDNQVLVGAYPEDTLKLTVKDILESNK